MVSLGQDCGRRSYLIGIRHGAFAQSDDAPIPDTIAQRVLACGSCHGAKGEGTDNAYFPRLAGKPAGYLHNQLVAFKNGRRHYPPMNYLLEFLPTNISSRWRSTSPRSVRPCRAVRAGCQ